jgi:hypothetical protein
MSLTVGQQKMKRLLLGGAALAAVVYALNNPIDHLYVPPAATPAAAMQTQAATVPQPSASELFKLQGECGKLGQKKLDALNSEQSNWRYLMRSNCLAADGRCYVEIDGQFGNPPWQFDGKIYDGQSDEMLAVWRKVGLNKRATGTVFDPRWSDPRPQRSETTRSCAARQTTSIKNMWP